MGKLLLIAESNSASTQKISRSNYPKDPNLMRTAIIATKCFKDYQIISWHLMDMHISEFVIPKNNHIYSLVKKYSEDNDNVPICKLDLNTSKIPSFVEKNFELIKDCDRLVVFWNGRHTGMAALIKYARDIGKEVSLVYAYPASTRRLVNA